MIANKGFASRLAGCSAKTSRTPLRQKVLFRADYEMIAKNPAYFGDFDPFGFRPDFRRGQAQSPHD